MLSGCIYVLVQAMGAQHVIWSANWVATAALWGVQGSVPTEGSVALVLGAGNQASVPPLDILHKLVVEGAVVICKMNPVNEYVGPFLRHESNFGAEEKHHMTCVL